MSVTFYTTNHFWHHYHTLQIMYYKATAAATTYTTMYSNCGKSFIAGGIPVRCVKE